MSQASVWPKRVMVAGAIILCLSIAAFAAYYSSYEEEVDPSKSHIVKINGGEESSVNLSKDKSYIVFRQTDSACECTIIEIDTQTEVSITAPNWMEGEGGRIGSGGKEYPSVGVFQPEADGVYAIQNTAANDTLWVVDRDIGLTTAAAMVNGGCFGMICGMCILPIGLLLWRRGNKSQPTANLVMQTAGGGIIPIAPTDGVQQQRIPTTDEIWRSIHGGESLNLVIEETHPPENDVPAPFADRPDRVGGVSRVVDEIESVEESAIEDVVEDGNPNERNWKVWDEG
ncbi:MAG: hypothetical protein QF454_06185 [Candidatus Thalassarchaeaceae archaeon]|nr:hypothetical protein [Candidatus Thalassarchaeaceae archaeon]